MIDFGCRGHDVAFDGTPDGLGAALEFQGVRNVQLALARSFPQEANPERLSPGLGATIRRALAAHGVEVAILGCYVNIIHPDLDEREAALRRFEAYLAHARFFGAPIVATETGSVDPSFAYTEDNFTPGAFEAAVASIRRLCATAERYGVVVGIEPGVNHPIHDVETTRRLIKRVDSPALGIVLDPTALITPQLAPRQLDIVRDALESFGDRVVATHLVDYRVEGSAIERCDIGAGVLDVEGVLAQVCAVKPGGYVITEFTEGDAIGRVVRRYGDRF